MLHGIEACHTRGVTHLDLKPSVIWEVAQPSGVVVKILDFGLAKLSNLAVLTADARQFFRPNGLSSESSTRLDFDHASATADVPVPPPHPWDGMEVWGPIAPFAFLSGVGPAWYMSPARWCGFATKAQQSSAEQPLLRLCQVPVGNLWLEREQKDVLGVSKVAPASPAVQGAIYALQLPEGVYFEVQLRKVWPHAMLSGTDMAVGLAIGFTRLPPQRGVSALNARARDWPLSWVVGYDGRYFQDGEEMHPTLNTPQFAVHEFRRQREAKLAGEDFDWPIGPLGWSFAELLRDDVVGLLAQQSGEIVIYVNGKVVSSISAGIGDAGPLFPLVEVCGAAREVALVSKPAGPGGEDEHDERLRTKDHQAAMIESLSTRSLSLFSDVYAAAVIALQVFQSHVLPEVPPEFVKLLVATQMWLAEGRPAIADHNGMLIALSDWASKVQNQSRVSGGNLSPEIEEVIQRVFESGSFHGTASIRSAEEFRSALNERTACSHVSPEFLRSHVAQHSIPSSKWRRQSKTAATGSENHEGPSEEGGVLWDLTPWTLSSSHVRRVMVVLESQDGARISSVNIGKLEANIPDELQLHFAECFEGPSGRNVERRTLPQLLFRDVPLPADVCPVSLAKLLEANAAGLLLRFVRRIDLAEAEESNCFKGPAAAKVIGSALRGNGSLNELKASNQSFGDTGVEYISKALVHGCQLLCLDLAHNQISSAGAQMLAQALMKPGSMLQHLELQNNELACSGCGFLAEMIKENNSLEYLGLQHNSIGASGAVSLGAALISNSCLEEIDLGYNSVGVAGSGALAAATRSNSSLQKLNLQDNGLEILAGTKLAEELSAGLQKDIDGLLDAVLPRQPMAKRSSAIKSRLQEGPAGTQLVNLNLRHNNLGSIGGAAVVAALQIARTELQELNLAWNGLGLETASALANLLGPQSLCTLTRLDLRDNRGLGLGAVLPKALHRLVANVPSEPIDKAPRSPRRQDAHLEQQESAQHLRWLNMANIDLDSEGAALLAPAMAIFSNLEELFLYNNPYLGRPPRAVEHPEDDWEGEPREIAVKPKEKDRKLQQGICRLARALATSTPSLKKLALGSCALGATLATELLSILSAHSELEDLSLCDNDLGTDQAQQSHLHTAIGKCLSSVALKRLDLALNELGDQCAFEIIATLVREQQQVIVDFGANKVSRRFRLIVQGALQDELAQGSDRPKAGDATKELSELLKGFAPDIAFKSQVARDYPRQGKNNRSQRHGTFQK